MSYYDIFSFAMCVWYDFYILMKSYTLLFCLLALLSNQTQYVPIPKKLVGIPFGNPNGQINIQLIYDPMCYDSRDFDVNIVRALQSQLPKQTLDQINWRMIGQAKPWHLTAHKIIQGITLVHDQKGASEALKCFRYFLDNIPSWDNTAVTNISINKYKQNLAQRFEILSGISRSTVLPQLNHTSTYDGRARQQFKHTTGNRHSGFNPTIYVNGAKVDDGMNLSLEQWKKLITDLLK